MSRFRSNFSGAASMIKSAAAHPVREGSSVNVFQSAFGIGFSQLAELNSFGKIPLNRLNAA